MYYVVVNSGDKPVEGETHTRLRDAERAAWILSAHNMKHGHAERYHVHGQAELSPFEDCNLPDWALEVLRGDPGALCHDCKH